LNQPIAPDRSLPWRTSVAFVLALVAQFALDPTGFSFGADGVNSLRQSDPERAVFVGAIFYGIAAAFLLWAYFTNEFSLPSFPEDQPANDPQTARENWIMAGIVLAGVAFVFLGSNLFTPLNVTLWLLAVWTFTRGVWLSAPDETSILARAKNFFGGIRLTRWILLLLAISALIVFFRFYRLDGVPIEPYSDHAEKLLDVYDITQGQTHIFFERNTGREFIQFYWTVLVAFLFNSGLTFLSLKIGTALIGLLTLPYIYLLGKEIGGKRVALFALILAGVAYWPNTMSRIGLRYPLYALFVAPVLFYLLRGLRTQNRNDFILCGLFLGLGLNGYSPFRFAPFVVVAAVGLYLLHKQAQGRQRQVLTMLTILVAASFLVFLPLFRYAIEHPDMFSYRAMTRLTDLEHPLPAPAWQVFLSNTLNAMLMFNWNNGDLAVPSRPALDIAAAVLFTFGYLLVFVRYLRQRRWQDIVLIVSVPLLLMPSILSLAFPAENPALNRTDGALVVVFVVAALALDGLYTAIQGVRLKGLRAGFALSVVVILLGMSTAQSYDLVFNRFEKEYRVNAWNTWEMGAVVRAFLAQGNAPDHAWVVPFPYWVDTRLVGIQSGLPTKDFAINHDALPETLNVSGAKLFIVKNEDAETLAVLHNLYPNGSAEMFDSSVDGKDFWMYRVP
jgi:hypothetical protein